MYDGFMVGILLYDFGKVDVFSLFVMFVDIGVVYFVLIVKYVDYVRLW